MSWVASAIFAGPAISGYLGSEATSDASDKSYAATKLSVDEQKRQYDLGRADLAPYREAGATALPAYQGFLGFDPQTGEYTQPDTNMYGPFQGGDRFTWDTAALESDPGYQFTRDQALQGTERAQNAMGNQVSGGMLTALQDRAGGVAAKYGQMYRDSALNEANTNYGRGLTEYGLDAARNTDMYGRDRAFLDQLAGITASGQNAATTGSNLGANYATNVGNTLMSGAANQGNLALAEANAWNNALQGGMSNYMLWDYLGKV